MKKEDIHRFVKMMKDWLNPIYKPIFHRIYYIVADSDNEWKLFLEENHTSADIRKNYFLPILALLVFVHLVSTVFAQILGADSSFWTSVVRSFFQTFLANFLCFTLSGWLLWVLLGNPSVKRTYLGDNFNQDKVSELIILPYCIYMLSLILSLWTVFFFVKYIAFFFSILIVWKGIKYVVPEISGSRKETMASLLIGVFPIFMSIICIKLIDLIMG